MARLKVELQDASEHRAKLQPAADAHANVLRTSRDNLRVSWAEHGMTHRPEVKAYRLKQHDAIVAAAERWGKQATAYKNLNAIIRQLGDELEKLAQENKQ